MSTVNEIIEAVKNLPDQQKGEFLDRLRDVNFEDAWDHQIEQDSKAGRLDKAWQAALEDIKPGRTKPLDRLLDKA